MTMRAYRFAMLAIVPAAIIATPHHAWSQQAPFDCHADARVDTSAWRRVQAGAYTVRLPRAYQDRHARGVDSDLRAYAAPRGRLVTSDFGMWSQSEVFERDADSTLAVCAPGSGTAAPRIVVYRDEERGMTAALFWPYPNGRVVHWPRGDQVEAFNVFASSRRDADLPELLAIIRSIRLADPSRVVRPGGGATH
jgi:hypothetical protein